MKRRKRLTRKLTMNRHQSKLTCESLEERQMLTCSSVEIDKYLWDVNGSPDTQVEIQAGDELIYSFDITNTGCDKLSEVSVSDSLPGIVMDDQVAVPYIAYSQGMYIPDDGNLGPFASVDRDLTSDPEEAKAWDNFSLSGATVIEGVTWVGAYVEPFASGDGVLVPETDFTVEIYKDNGGVPGALEHAFTLKGGQAGVSDALVTSTLLSHTAEDGGPVYEYEAMLPFTVVAAGEYWISITAQQTFPNAAPTIDPTWQWHLGSGPGDGFYTFDDTFDTVGDNNQGDVDEVARPANTQPDKDLAFELHAARLEDFDGCLEPGETVMFMGTYIVTEEDIAAGMVLNTATVTAENPDGERAADTDTVIVYTPLASLDVDKYLWDINGSPELTDDIQPGDELIYAFEVTNNGKEKLDNVTVADSLPGFQMVAEVVVSYVAYEQAASVPGDGNLGPYASVDRDLASDPEEAKAWDNFSLAAATVVEGVEWRGAYVEPFATGDGAATAETNFLVEIFNDASGMPGTIHSSFTLAGGEAGVSDVDVSSTLLGYTAADGGPVYDYEAKLPFTVLNPGDYWISITALQTFPSADPVVDPTWQWHLGAGPGDGFYTYDDTFDDAGDDNAALVDGTPVPTLFEDGKDLAFTLNGARQEEFDGCLYPGETVVFMGTYVVTEDDFMAGEILNSATAEGETPSGEVITAGDTDVVIIDNSDIEIDKYLWDINGLPELHTDLSAGDVLIYAFEVTNTGYSKLDNVTVTDSLPGFVMDPEVLVPYVAFAQDTYVPGDGNLGPYASVNVALASDPEEAKAWDNFSLGETTVIEGIEWAGAYVEPFASGAGSATPETDFLVEIFSDDSGLPGTIHSSFTLDGGDAGVSDGNVASTLLDHTAADGGPVYGYEATLPFTVFEPGDYWISITALQTFPSEDPVVDPTWQWHLGAGAGDGFYTYDDTFDDAGDDDAALVDGTPTPTLFEDGKDLAFTLHAARQEEFDGCLYPGETVVFMGTYVVTDGDVAAGQIENTATADGEGPTGPVSGSDTDVVIIDPISSIEIDKYLWDINGLPDLDQDIVVGDVLIYSFDVTNTGSTKLSNVTVTDALPGMEMDPQVLEPYTAFEQEMVIPDDGSLGPYASVDVDLASDPEEAKAWDNFSLADATVIDLISWTGAYVEPFATGDGVATPETDFLVEIFNDDGTGQPGSLHTAFALEGGLAGVSDGNVSSTLLGHTAADGGPVYAYEAMLPFTVLTAGDYWISITAQQTFPNAAPTIDPTWQWHLGSGSGDGFYTYDDTFDDPGDNDVGDVDSEARPVIFEDGKDLAFALHAARKVDFNGCLEPGETVMFMGTYVVTQADVDAGEILNTAVVSAEKPTLGHITGSDTLTLTTSPSIEIDKYLWDVNGSPALTHELQVGDELIYSFDVTNVGSDKLSDVSVSDSLPGIVIDPQVALPYIAYSQGIYIPGDGNLGPFASVDRELSSDPEEAKAWDNFSLSEATVIEGIQWVGAYIEPFASGDGMLVPATDFTVEIYADDGGIPGALEHAFSLQGGQAGVSDALVTSTLLSHTAEDGGPVYEYEAMLPFTVVAAGEYWISITAQQTFPNAAPTIDPTWQWHLGSGPGDGFYTFDDTFDTVGDNNQGDVDEVARPANTQPDKDLAFELHAARLVDFDGCLEPGETVMFMGTYIVTQDDINNGGILNSAVATGTLPNGGEASDSDTFDWKITTPGSADLNGDGAVDFADFLILSANYGQNGGHAEGDLDHNGLVGFEDFMILSGQYGNTAAAADAAFADGDDWID